MATAEELINAELGGEFCKIDVNSRVISIPESLLPFGVESDESCKVIKFKMDNIFKNIEGLVFSINYVNSEKNKDAYIVTDVTDNNGTLEFSWTLSRKLTVRRGEIYFIVCVRKYDEDHNVIYEWNTTVAKANVLEGLELDAISETELYQDVIGQLLTMITSSDTVNSTVDKFVTDKSTELDTRIDAINTSVTSFTQETSSKLEEMSNTINELSNRFPVETVLHNVDQGDAEIGVTAQVACSDANLAQFDFLDVYTSYQGKNEVKRIPCILNTNYAFRTINIPNDASTTAVGIAEIYVELSETGIKVLSATKWAWSGTASSSSSIINATVDGLEAGYIYKIIGIKNNGGN